MNEKLSIQIDIKLCWEIREAIAFAIRDQNFSTQNKARAKRLVEFCEHNLLKELLK